MVQPLTTSLYLPIFLASWPYDRRVNPHYLEVSKAAYSWISSYELLTPKLQRTFERFNSGLLAALAYPEVSTAHLRVVCDALNIVFLFDDYSDIQEPQIVREVADTIVDALYNPSAHPKPHVEDHGRFGEITRSFWSRSLKTLSASCARRFIAAFCEYSEAIVQQAYDRSQEHIRDIESYLVLRRYTIGAKLGFALLDCQDAVLNHPRIGDLETAAIDLISLSNDVYSYNIEQSRGDDAHNMLTCIMNSENVSLQEAMSRMQAYILTLEQRFLVINSQIQDEAGSHPADASLLAYIDGIGNWVRANDTWSFESQRYFGSKGLEIQAQRTLELWPKRSSSQR